MIRIECPSCGAKLRGPDDSAGKQIKCPKCGGNVTVPEPVYEAEPLAADLPPAGAYDLDDVNPYKAPSTPADEGRKPCPMCGEMIVATAAQCRFCGEIFDPNLKKAKAKRGSGDDEDLSTGDWVVAVLCSGIGCIAGIVWMIQGKPKGKKMLGISVLMNVIWFVIRIALQSATKNVGP
jgi:predicted RNA-binding Zn-ribbon protein involved in translation (DUF1610 family)